MKRENALYRNHGEKHSDRVCAQSRQGKYQGRSQKCLGKTRAEAGARTARATPLDRRA
jgi:hypothetical protein